MDSLDPMDPMAAEDHIADSATYLEATTRLFNWGLPNVISNPMYPADIRYPPYSPGTASGVNPKTGGSDRLLNTLEAAGRGGLPDTQGDC